MHISPPHCDNSCGVYRQSANVVNVKTTMERAHQPSNVSCALIVQLRRRAGQTTIPQGCFRCSPAGHLREVQKFDLTEVQRTRLEQLRVAIREAEAEVLRKEG